MSRQNTTVADVVNDFLLTLSEDDYVSNVADYHVHNLALRGIREMGFDVTKRVKSLSLPISDLGTVDMPDDFVGMLRCGVSGSDGTFYTFKENKNMDMAQEYKLASNGQPIDSDNDGVYDRQALSSSSTMPMQGDNLSNAVNDACIAVVQDVTAIECFAPVKSHHISSNFLTFGPCTSQPLSIKSANSVLILLSSSTLVMGN